MPTRVTTLTSLAMIAFASNSILCREALGSIAVDAASFTAIRIASGALALYLLTALRRSADRRPRGGSWLSALALVGYAVAFSFAYLRLAAGVGALVLFGCVQATMIGAGIRRGERLAPSQWVGLAIAIAGLIFLTAPGGAAPDPLGVALMAIAGIAWGIYSLRGRGASDPLGATADNFLRGVPLALAPLALVLLVPGALPALRLETRGVLLAVASGALASGVGYAIWYAALRDLPATRAAVVQLVVPVLAAVAGVLLLGETATSRLLIGGAAIVAGLAITLRGRTRPSRGPGGAARG